MKSIPHSSETVAFYSRDSLERSIQVAFPTCLRLVRNPVEYSATSVIFSQIMAHRRETVNRLIRIYVSQHIVNRCDADRDSDMEVGI